MDKKQDKINTQIVRYFWRHAWRYPGLVLGILTSIPIANLLLWFIPSLLVANIFNAINQKDYISGDLWGSFGAELVWYIFLVFLSGILIWRIAIFFVWTLERHVMRDIHREIFAHLMNLSAGFHANHFGGSLVSQANKLAGAYVRMADTTWFNLYGLLLAFAFTMIILYPLAPVTASMLLLFSIVFMIVSVRLTRIIRSLSGTLASKETKQTGTLADAVTNVLAVKSFAGGAHEGRR
jgi:ATP-binding cassette subfamily B protein